MSDLTHRQTIPEKIHQIWIGNDEVPNSVKCYTHTWREQHPHWEYRLWDEMSCKQLIVKDFPFIEKLYQSLSYNIQRVDLLKYLILYSEGGLYVDLDYECLKSIKELIVNEVCIGLEPKSYALFHNCQFFLGNAFMASNAQHEFFKKLISNLMLNLASENILGVSNANKYSQVMKSTGPVMFNEYFRNNNSQYISLIAPELIAPLTKQEATIFREFRESAMQNSKLKNAYAVHHFMGSWL